MSATLIRLLMFDPYDDNIFRFFSLNVQSLV